MKGNNWANTWRKLTNLPCEYLGRSVLGRGNRKCEVTQKFMWPECRGTAGAGLAKRKEGEMKSERERGPGYGDLPSHLFLMRRKCCAVH